MVTDNGDDVVTFAGGILDQHRHVCAFVNWQDEDLAVLDSFVRQGIDSGDRIVYLVDPADVAEPINRLQHLGYDAADLLNRRQCEVQSWADTYLNGGRFNPDAMLTLLDRMFDDRDSPRVRLVANMGWAIGEPGFADQLIEFEARANFVNLRRRHIAICAYDTAKFDGALIIDILRTHPMVLVGGVLQENPFFVPPAEFLRQKNLR
ncbi:MULTISPECIES: MEDS domain-containing protein [unclassified Leifsonia]|uniref:MEDS domain-containing protein n=1 Tax=unclassified Leifsonia TaxID=2663824 RepID=UPI0006FD6EDE|nr:MULTISPECIES: MEDS domain-containing protein [unclassified Leifsonia]KQX07752.1 hypothetical protein ASC59_08475 [Leifsonia sp. Root1293]KRA12034.1 hypothetical protein ASD61_08475 [Leifsonia sp. Root60]